MQELNPKLKLLKDLMYQIADNIDPNNCQNQEDKIDAAIESLSILNRGIPRISKAEACEKILHCSARTFENYVQLGIIPKGKKVAHFKELSWAEKDFDRAKEYRRLHP